MSVVHVRAAARVEIPDLGEFLCVYVYENVNMDVSVFDNVYGCGCLYLFVVHVRASKCAHGVKATSGPGASVFVMWTVLVYMQSCRVPKEHKENGGRSGLLIQQSTPSGKEEEEG